MNQSEIKWIDVDDRKPDSVRLVVCLFKYLLTDIYVHKIGKYCACTGWQYPNEPGLNGGHTIFWSEIDYPEIKDFISKIGKEFL